MLVQFPGRLPGLRHGHTDLSIRHLHAQVQVQFALVNIVDVSTSKEQIEVQVWDAKGTLPLTHLAEMQ